MSKSYFLCFLGAWNMWAKAAFYAFYAFYAPKISD